MAVVYIPVPSPAFLCYAGFMGPNGANDDITIPFLPFHSPSR